MIKPPPKILLLCSGRLAVPTLQLMAQQGVLLGVVVPDTDPKVIQLLQQLASSVQCAFYSLSRPQFAVALAEICTLQNPDAVFAVGFPWQIPESLLRLPPQGFLNFHGGLLPDLRGPDPIFEAVRQQLPETALTIHRMDAGWDTGPIIYEDRFALRAGLTHGLLSTQMAFRCAEAASLVVKRIQEGVLSSQPQVTARIRYYHRVSGADLYINWATQPIAAIVALIRACNPIYGGAATIVNGWIFRIVEASVSPGLTHTATPGTLLGLDENQGALVQCCHEAVLQVRIIGTDEGYFPAARLHEFGLAPGTTLGFPDLQTIPA